MPKTYAKLWPKLISWENFREAYRKCRRRKRFKKAACEFDFNWEENLLALRDEVASNCWVPGAYHNFRIQDPKPRLISAAPFRDRVVHHAIVNVLEPIFERRFIYDSYACRQGKGTHAAVRRAQYYLRRHPWYLKTDIVQFFPNVDHEILLRLLARVVRDPKVLDLLSVVIDSGLTIPPDSRTVHFFSGDDLLASLRPCGLPIGNLTSQFFANVFLDWFDHYIKEELRVPGYVRYADDLLLLSDSKQSLWEAERQMSAKLAEIRLRLHPDKTHVGRAERGVKFLGLRVFPWQRRLSQNSIRRMNHRIRQWRWEASQGNLDLQSVRNSIQAWTANAKNANSYAIRRVLMNSIKLHVRSQNQNRARLRREEKREPE